MSDPQNNTVTQFSTAITRPPETGEKTPVSLPEIVQTNIENAPEPRRFIYERLYIRGNVTGTAATGGTGKHPLWMWKPWE